IANTMFVSVIERTTEIGTLKALGFKAREVLGVFLLEASLTGVAGGVLGCLMGVGVAYGIGSLLKFPGSAGARAAGGGPATSTAATTAGRGGTGGTGRAGAGGFGGGGGGFGGPGSGGGGGGAFGAASANVQAHPVFTFAMFATVIVFAVVVAVVAGVIPARKAARMDPVLAL